MRFAYADPPYLGCGKLYAKHHPEALIWDDPATHVDLAQRLVDEYPDGWVLSCNPRDLRVYLPALPDDVRMGAYCKTWHQIRPTSVQFAWEPILFRGGRSLPKRNPMIRDYLVSGHKPGGLVGNKPDKFNRWVLDVLGYEDGDTVDDLFPGTGGMSEVLAQGVLL
jgi:hypothetical protein